MKQENNLSATVDNFWDALMKANDELNSFISSGMPSTTEKRHKDFVRCWNIMKDRATTLCDLLEQQFVTKVDPVEITLPWNTDTFVIAWHRWKEYLEEQHHKYMKSRMEHAALAYLKKLSDDNEATAIEYLQFAMANGYPRFFKVTTKNYEQPTVAGGRSDGDY